jgi:hypothetical protein
MRIEIIYQTRDGTAPVRLSLTPEAYFDPLGPGETYEADGVPRYNHTWQYLDVPPSRLKWSLEGRAGTGDDAKIRTQYLDGGRSWMTHRSDPDGSEELIHFNQLSEDRCHIVRTLKTEQGGWAVHYNAVIEKAADGSERELRYDQPWSFEQAIEYARLDHRR